MEGFSEEVSFRDMDEVAPPSRARAFRPAPRRLTADDERRLTSSIEEAEAEMVRALAASPGARAALACLHAELSSGVLRIREVVRNADSTPGAERRDSTPTFSPCESITRGRVLEALALAGTLGEEASAEELRVLGDRLIALRLLPSVLERAAEAMGASDDELRRAFAGALRTSRLAKAEWAAASAYLVVAIARRYRRSGVDTVDLVQDGNIGLIRAVEKFDSSLGHRFHVYAAWWIRQHIFRALASYGGTIRIPLPMVEVSHRLARARRIFEGIHGTLPSDAELAALCGVDLATVEAVGRIAAQPVSFHARLGEEETSALEHLVDRAADLPDELVARADLNDRVRTLFEALPRREQFVLRLRFGLDGEREHSNLEVAATLRVSRERARRIEEHALAKLRVWSARGSVPGGSPASAPGSASGSRGAAA
jgi:RNA polymerase primary sigma factor